MPARRYHRIVLPLLLSATLWPAGVAASDVHLEQVFPRLAGKNQVRWYRFDWQETEFHPTVTGASVHLYFYKDEANVARHARAAIEAAYRDLAVTFDFFPATSIPFLLYNSHFEFQSTRAFLISEGVLGVTSTEDLRMAVPYWGEHRRFGEVMRHEMVHQFSIQKILKAGRKAGCNPLQELPLWFVEGIAQYYSLPDLTPDARAELILRATATKGDDKLPQFFRDDPLTFERVYLLGHAQVAFLDGVYGAGTTLRIIKRAGEMCNRRTFFGSRDGDDAPFPRLVGAVVGARPQAVNARWRSWAREQAAPARAALTPAAVMTTPRHGDGDVDSFSVSPDGRTLFYRTIDVETGEARLYLQDSDRSDARSQAAADQRTGLESLHPVDRRVTAIGADRLAYIGRTGASDEIFVGRYRREGPSKHPRFRVTDLVRHPLTSYGSLIEAGYPAIDPITGRVAFVALDRRSGYLDVYALTRPFDERSPLERLTNDAYAEQGLDFARDGSLFTASDATADRRYAVVQVQGARAALPRPAAAVDALAPSAGRGGVVFQSSATGLDQAYRATATATTRLTDAPTGLQQPVLDPQGGLYGIVRVRGKRALVHVPASRILALPVTTAAPGSPQPLPTRPLGRIREYDPYDPQNYSLVGAQAAAALGPFAVGQAVFADTFRNHVVGLTAFYSGDIGEFEAAYLDQTRRVAYGGSIFLENGLQLETPVSTLAEAYLLRRFGGSFDVEYPLNPFLRLNAGLAPEHLRAYRFSEPSSEFANSHRLSAFATEARTGVAFDSLGYSLYGPSRGQSFTLDARGTLTFGEVDPFADIAADYQVFYSPLRRVRGLTATLRAAGATSLGGRFREQFFLPAAYNYRVVREGSVDLFGEHYAVSQLALLFPLSPVWGRAVFIQGTLGADTGAIVFAVNELWRSRRAAGVGGVNFGLGPLVVRLHISRPFSIGGDEQAKNVWNSYISVLLSPLLLAY